MTVRLPAAWESIRKRSEAHPAARIPHKSIVEVRKAIAEAVATKVDRHLAAAELCKERVALDMAAAEIRAVERKTPSATRNIGPATVTEPV